MNGRISECQLRTSRCCRITENTIISRMDIRMRKNIIVTILMKAHSLPLTTNPVVRKILKHLIQTVTTQHHRIVCCAFTTQCSVNIKGCLLREINSCSSRNCQCSTSFYLQCILENKRFRTGQSNIRCNLATLYQLCIPAVDT